jgi:hypothetical protein
VDFTKFLSVILENSRTTFNDFFQNPRKEENKEISLIKDNGHTKEQLHTSHADIVELLKSWEDKEGHNGKNDFNVSINLDSASNKGNISLTIIFK